MSDERRRHSRGDIVAACHVFAIGRHLGTFAVHDLSAGGARLVGNAPAAAGETLRLLLQMPRRPAITVAARVLRQDGHGSGRRFVVEFLDVGADDEDAIHQGIVAELERVRAARFATVLVVDQAGESRDALERDLRAEGREAISVATPLEAIAWLTSAEVKFETAIVNLASGVGQGIDVLDFLAAEFPSVRRVVMGDESTAYRLELAVRSGRAHTSLVRPWRGQDLKAVGR